MRSIDCPRCRASGRQVAVIVNDGYGVCGICNTAWQLGEHDEPVALGYVDPVTPDP